jgi:hypothetical protein
MPGFTGEQVESKGARDKAIQWAGQNGEVGTGAGTHGQNCRSNRRTPIRDCPRLYDPAGASPLRSSSGLRSWLAARLLWQLHFRGRTEPAVPLLRSAS